MLFYRDCLLYCGTRLPRYHDKPLTSEYIAVLPAPNLSGSHATWATFSTTYHDMTSSLQLDEHPKISSTMRQSRKRCQLSEFGDWGPTFHLTASHLGLDHSPEHLDATYLSSDVRDHVQAIIDLRELRGISPPALPKTKWTRSCLFVTFTPGEHASKGTHTSHGRERRLIS